MKVKMWIDKWINDTPFNGDIPRSLFNQHKKNCTVVDCYANGGWNLLLRRNLYDWEIKHANALIQKLELVSFNDPSEDTLWWKYQKDGKFTVIQKFLKEYKRNQ